MGGKLFELMGKMYSEFTEFRKETNTRLDKIEGHLTVIQQDHGKKLESLFDGHKQHSDQLDRIEDKVSKHDEFIMRRVK